MYSWGVGTPQSDPNLKKKFFFDQSTSVIFNSVSVLCSLCRGYKGIWDATFFSLSLSLSVCVLHMCEYSWFQKHALFYFLSFTVGNWVCCTHCWLSPQHLLPAPPPHPQQSLISIWGSGVPEMLILLPFPDLVTILLESLAFDCSFSHSE